MDLGNHCSIWSSFLGHLMSGNNSAHQFPGPSTETSAYVTEPCFLLTSHLSLDCWSFFGSHLTFSSAKCCKVGNIDNKMLLVREPINWQGEWGECQSLLLYMEDSYFPPKNSTCSPSELQSQLLRLCKPHMLNSLCALWVFHNRWLSCCFYIWEVSGSSTLNVL